jgi:hypothetical protein
MADHHERIRAAFRLNLEQQRKQAKELLKAAKAGDVRALSRLTASIAEPGTRVPGAQPKLANAQHTIARELRFSNWAELKSHIAALERAEAAIRDQRMCPDADVKTLHLRCGSDIRGTLQDAGFGGDFLEVSYPYCHGPVTSAPDHLEQEARFIVEVAGRHMDVSFEHALEGRHNEERALAACAEHYERIVLWMEHDCFDQLILARVLAHFAVSSRPRVLELVGVNHFPGRGVDGMPLRFIGLGQLPREALRLLWDRRREVTREQLELGLKTFEALRLDDPRPLATLMRTESPVLPDIGTALHRFLQELPSARDGLSLTERLILQVLCEGPISINRLFGLLTYQRDPLFFATDLFLLWTIERMQAVEQPVFTRSGARVFRDELAITDMGRAVASGARDWLSLRPPPRWVGGVRIQSGARVWRWDEAKRAVVDAQDPVRV